MDDSDDEAPQGSGVAPGDAPDALPEPTSSEELRRLCDLLQEQQLHLTRLMESRAEGEEGEGLLELISQGQEHDAVAIIRAMRPAALLQVSDPAGMTPLHWGVRVYSLGVVFALLDKVPEMADKPTNLGRLPPHYCRVPARTRTMSRWGPHLSTT